jgi:hypothetical protein
MSQIKRKELEVSFSTLVYLHTRGWNGWTSSRIRDRSTWTANNLAKALDFIVAQKPNLLEFVHALFLDKGLSSGLGKTNTGHNPAHNSVVHGRKGSRTAKTKEIEKVYGRSIKNVSVVTDGPLNERDRPKSIYI